MATEKVVHSRARRHDVLVALTRLYAQAGVNAAEAEGLRRGGEAAAWLSVRDFLGAVIAQWRAQGFATTQPPLF